MMTNSVLFLAPRVRLYRCLLYNYLTVLVCCIVLSANTSEDHVLYPLLRGLQTFSAKGQIGQILSFEGHRVCLDYAPLPL